MTGREMAAKLTALVPNPEKHEALEMLSKVRNVTGWALASEVDGYMERGRLAIETLSTDRDDAERRAAAAADAQQAAIDTAVIAATRALEKHREELELKLQGMTALADRAAKQSDHYVSMLDTTDKMRLEAEAGRHRVDEMLGAVTKERDAAQARAEEYKREVERRDELLRGADADRNAAQALAELNQAQAKEALDSRDALGAENAMLRETLTKAQRLADEVDQGPRAENSSEWRIPWSRYTVEVFSDVARALSAGASDWLESHDKGVDDEAREAEARTWEIALDEGVEPNTRCAKAVNEHDARVRAASDAETSKLRAWVKNHETEVTDLRGQLDERKGHQERAEAEVQRLTAERDEAQRKLFEYHTYPEREIERQRTVIAGLEARLTELRREMCKRTFAEGATLIRWVTTIIDAALEAAKTGGR